MAQQLTAVNPWVVAWPGNSPPQMRQLLATNSKTWKRGQLGAWSSGTVTPVEASGLTDAPFILCEDQATSTSTTTVWVQQLQHGTELMIFTMNAGTAAAIGASNRGVRYGIRALNNVSYIDVATTSGSFEVISLASELFPYGGPCGSTASTLIEAPGLCLVRYMPIS